MNVEWQLEALCALFPDLPWITEPSERPQAAVAAMTTVCAACPVYAACESYVVRTGIVSGFWAGEDRTPSSGLSSSGGAA